jgi:lipoic acid synthetase
MLVLASRKKKFFKQWDLRAVNVDTIGQYLQPSKKHLPVKEFMLHRSNLPFMKNLD